MEAITSITNSIFGKGASIPSFETEQSLYLKCLPSEMKSEICSFLSHGEKIELLTATCVKNDKYFLKYFCVEGRVHTVNPEQENFFFKLAKHDTQYDIPLEMLSYMASICPDAVNFVREPEGFTPLLVACREGHYNYVKLLHRYGADVNILTNQKNSALILAAWKKQTNVVKYLIDAGADMNISNVHNSTALTWASSEKDEESAIALIKNGANLKCQTNEGFSPLLYAAVAGQVDVVRHILDAAMKAQIEAEKQLSESKERQTTNTTVEQKIEESNSHDTTISTSRSTPQSAASNGSTSATTVTKHQSGGDHQTPSSTLPVVAADTDKPLNGDEPLTASFGYYDEVLNHVTNQNNSALLLAAWKKHTDVVIELVSRGADVSIKNNHNSTALTWASSGGDRAMVECLVKARANLEDTTNEGCTPLIHAASNGKHDIVKVLLDGKCNSIHQTDAGNTPLMLAAWKGHIETIKLLLQNKDVCANLELRNNTQLTALKYAINHNKVDVVKALLLAGATNPYTSEDEDEQEYVRNVSNDAIRVLLINGGLDEEDLFDENNIDIDDNNNNNTTSTPLVTDQEDDQENGTNAYNGVDDRNFFMSMFSPFT